MSDIPAFPRRHVTEADDGTLLVHFDPGMTLRDYFAAKAMPAIYTEYVRDAAVGGWAEDWRDRIAQGAYKMADAMLKAREAK